MRTLASIVYLSSLMGAIGVASCVGGSSEPSADDKSRLKAFVSDKAPSALPNKLNINYDGKVTLLGYAIDPPGSLGPGQRVKLTMYWRSDKKLDEGWNLFTHLVDGSGERVLNIDNVGPIREWRENQQALSPSAWEPGKVYTDEQVFSMPSVKTDTVQIVTGIWRQAERLPPVSGPHDKERRGIVATISTSATAAKDPIASTRVPTLQVNELDKSSTIKIDGKLDEPAWQHAATTGPFVDVSSGRVNPIAPVGGQAKLLWNDDYLYVGFQVHDTDVRGGFSKDEKDPHLWTKDTVEIMVDPDGDGDNENYYEIQINPQNLVFDSQFDSYNQPKVEPNGPFGHQDWSAKLKSAVTVKGSLDDNDDKDEGYVIEAQIPWKSFSKAKTVPPVSGDTWRMNFYAMQDNGGVAWSPILGQGNFHKASRFGRVLWTKPDGAADAAAAHRGASANDAGANDVASAKTAIPSGIDIHRIPRVKLPGTVPAPPPSGAH